MKKSFMTRVLAMGLSFAMAFSLSAATNVTTASAAAKKVGVTTMMKVSTKSVTEGKTVKTYMNSTALKKYRIKKVAKLSAVADKYIDVDVITSGKKARQGLEITAHEGAVTAAKLTKKGVYVTIYFAQTTSATKAAKATAVKYAKLKVAVNAKPVEKTTMTAAATAVKEITLTFSKAVADTTAAKVAVKKANATPTFTVKWADDAKSATLAMDSKLTAGTYDITVSGVEKEDLTASVVAEDQKLATFKLLSTNLVANDIPVSYGSIRIQGVDQYGNAMKVDKVTITSSFGTFGTMNNGTFSAVPVGTTVTMKDSEPYTASFQITSALAILGTKGTITVVEGNTGVNVSEDITLVAPAKASKLENLGLYNMNKGKFMDMTAGDKIADYAIALKLYDQYDVECKADAVKGSGEIQTTVAGGVTNVAATVSEDAIKIDGKDVYVLKLNAVTGRTEVKAGTIQVTVVNNKVGLLDNLSFTVAPGTVIKSFTVTADNDIYANEENTLSYTAIDTEGNEVTKYDVIKKALTTCPVTINKQADGTAKLVFTPTISNANNTDHKAYEQQALTFMLYENTANIIVYNTTVKVNQRRIIAEVNGVDSSKAIATTTGVALKFKMTDFKLADQYGNTLTKDQIKNVVANNNQKIVATVLTGSTGWTVTGSAVGAPATITSATDDIIITPGSIADAKVNFKAFAQGNYSDDGFDLALSVVNEAKASDFAIEWLKDGLNVFCVSNQALTLAQGKDFQVVGKVAGKKVIIPQSSCAIVGGGTQKQVAQEAGKDKITKEATLSVSVDDEDHNSNIITATYTYSNEDPKLAVLEAKDGSASIASSGSITIGAIIAATNGFKIKDQYGQDITTAPSDMIATIAVTGSGNKGSVVHNDTIKAEVLPVAGEPLAEITVTLTCGTLKATKKFSVS